MAWVHYRLKLRLLSPLHIGYRKVGNLMQTRRYVPGKVLWAALTARLTRDNHNGSQGEEYQRLGHLVRCHFRFSYLWPALGDEEPYWPWCNDDFDYLLLNSYAGTALNYDQKAAQEGSLHETEFIAPRDRDGKGVYLVGDLWARENDASFKDLMGWREMPPRLQLGGERTYGWGRVACAPGSGCIQRCEAETLVLTDYQWETRGNEIVVTADKDTRLPAHALAYDFEDRQAVQGVSGPIEPLVGRETRKDGRFGVQLSRARICYVPGSTVESGAAFQIGPYGIWEAAK